MDLPYDIRYAILEQMTPKQNLRAFLKRERVGLELSIIARVGNIQLRRECLLVALNSCTMEIHSGPGSERLRAWLAKVDFTNVGTSCKTGFDAITGGIKAIDIRSDSGGKLVDKWESGVRTALGVMVSGFPNMFSLYGPQGPTAFANGPSCIEVQGDWITSLLVDLRAKGLETIDATPEAEERWRKLVIDEADTKLYGLADSWYMGANVPGKPREMLNYTGGIPRYAEELRAATETGYKEFVLA